MTSLVIHATLGVVTTIAAFVLNAHLYRSDWRGRGVTAVEGLYYVLAVASVCAGWFFNVRYVAAYPDEASWAHFTSMLFTNPAASSGGQDLIVTNAILFPLWMWSDGARRGLRVPMMFFIMSLFTSFGFSMGLYLAAQERQVRWNAGRSD